jgi:hypothetical protein
MMQQKKARKAWSTAYRNLEVGDGTTGNDRRVGVSGAKSEVSDRCGDGRAGAGGELQRRHKSGYMTVGRVLITDKASAAV